MTPEVEEIERLPELNVKLLPDCVIVKLAPAPVKDCVQGKLAAFVESTWIAQRPPTEMGALSFCPSLNTPTIPTNGRATNKRYDSAKLRVLAFTCYPSSLVLAA